MLTRERDRGELFVKCHYNCTKVLIGFLFMPRTPPLLFMRVTSNFVTPSLPPTHTFIQVSMQTEVEFARGGYMSVIMFAHLYRKQMIVNSYCLWECVCLTIC